MPLCDSKNSTNAARYAARSSDSPKVLSFKLNLVCHTHAFPQTCRHQDQLGILIWRCQHQRFPRQIGGTGGNGLLWLFHNGTSDRYTIHAVSHREAGYAPAWHVHSPLSLPDAKSRTQAVTLVQKSVHFFFNDIRCITN